jgi:hypothetical protein
MIYTSYFAKLRKLPPNLVPVSIALYKPSFYSGLSYPKLAPSQTLLTGYKNGTVSEQLYRDTYMKQLNGLDPEQVVSELLILITPWLERQYGSGFVKSKDSNLLATTLDFGVVLTCYEANTFCHRHIVAEWLRYHDIYCEELLL